MRVQLTKTINTHKMDSLQLWTYQNIEVDDIVNYRIIEKNKSKIDVQKTIFDKIEHNLNFENGTHLSNLVHFQSAPKTPIQRWYPYREGFSINLVNSFLKELNITGNVFDPFVGSGTTLLSARNYNLNSFGTDVNPISILIAEVSNEVYFTKEIIDAKEILNEIINSNNQQSNIKTNFQLADKAFNAEILQTLLNLKIQINQIQNIKIQRLLFVAWLSIIEQVSNVKKEGNGIKYKNRKRTTSGYINIDKEVWENETFPKDKINYVKTIYKNKVELILNDIANYYGAIENKPQIFNTNCINFNEKFQDNLQFAFFSPPYCNSFDYFEIHKVELWLGDFVTTHDELKKLRIKGFRSNSNALNGKKIEYKNDYIEKLIGLFDEQKLWHKQIPNVVRGYFDDMYQLLKNIYLQTEKNGFVGIVVGNSAYSEIIIPTDAIIADFAKEIGFSLEKIYVTRHLTTSSQQKTALSKLNNYLRESIIILKK